MIVRSIDEIAGTERDVGGTTWQSKRLLVASDGMGFSLHETTMFAGLSTTMHYKHHFEAVYCVSGEGEIESLEDGRKWQIRPGVVYALDKHDRHVLRAHTAMRLVCVFNPPVVGREKHDESGAYPPAPAEKK